MNADEFVQRFAPWRAAHVRRAWLPEIGVGATRSRFGGAPEMTPGEPWPTCANCKEPMRFLLQVDLLTLPQRPPGAGLLQLFYCKTDEGDCETWSPTGGANLARLVDGELVARLPPAGLALEKERAIVGWQEVPDNPGPQEHQSLGLRYEYDFANNKVRVICPEIGFDEAGLDMIECSAEAIAEARHGDKLFGWPRWSQGAEYPCCTQCQGRMELVFQVDSEHGVNVMFGDMGVGHITQCPKHPKAVAFGWACG